MPRKPKQPPKTKPDNQPMVPPPPPPKKQHLVWQVPVCKYEDGTVAPIRITGWPATLR